MWLDEGAYVPVFTETLRLDMSTVEPSLAGPKRPQDKVLLSQVDDEFRLNFTREYGDPEKELPHRFAAVATDVRTRQAVVIDSGPLNIALRATIAVPGLLPPVRRGGQVLMDGGMVDNVPISAARHLGASTVIVVRLHAKWENVRMMRMVSSAAELEEDPSIILVQPEMEGLAQWSMGDVPKLIEEGRRAAATALDAVKNERT